MILMDQSVAIGCNNYSAIKTKFFDAENYSSSLGLYQCDTKVQISTDRTNFVFRFVRSLHKNTPFFSLQNTFGESTKTKSIGN